MARPPRSDFPGAWHHVMHRGARRAPIFKRDDHCTMFLDAIGDATQRSGLEVHAYALMPNHFHLLVRSPRATLSRGMKYLLASYVQRVNKLRSWDGPMFRGRFKNQLVTRDDYLRHLMAYIHLNPVRAHLVARPDEPCWTSFRAHMGLESAPSWLHASAVREWFGGAVGLRAWVHEVQVGRQQAPEQMSRETGWFRSDSDAERGPAAVTSASNHEQLLRRLVEVTGATPEVLRSSRSGRAANPARRFAALVLVNDEALSHAEVAGILGTTPKTVANLVYRAAQGGSDPALAGWREAWAAHRALVTLARHPSRPGGRSKSEK